MQGAVKHDKEMARWMREMFLRESPNRGAFVLPFGATSDEIAHFRSSGWHIRQRRRV
jgi:hypothetical protein